MKKYVIAADIWKNLSTGKYEVTFLDFPECSAEGEDFLEAYYTAWNELRRHLYDLEKAKKLIPESSYFTDSLYVRVPMEVNMLEIRRIYDVDNINKSLKIPRWLDDLAKDNKINFTRTLREALMEKLEIKD